MSGAVVLVVAVLVLANLLNHVWLPRASVVTGPVVAVLLVGVGKLAGLTWTELGMGRRSILTGVVWAVASAVLVALGYSIALALPFAHRAAPAPPSTRTAMYACLVEVPFATVLLEEVAFRGVLWGLLDVDHGPWFATGVSSLLFGLWHVAGALEDDGVGRPEWLSGWWGAALWVAGTVLFTAAAGVLFAEVRRRSGSVFAAMGLHWATNGIGTLFALLAPKAAVRRAAARRR
jgi:membrane protease YdiL (CAAX protease family)